MERQCHHDEIRAGWPYPDPAPLAMPPLWGFGGDGARAVANRKDLKDVASQHTQQDKGRACQAREEACKA